MAQLLRRLGRLRLRLRGNAGRVRGEPGRPRGRGAPGAPARARTRVVVENYTGGTAATDWTGEVVFGAPTRPSSPASRRRGTSRAPRTTAPSSRRVRSSSTAASRWTSATPARRPRTEVRRAPEPAARHPRWSSGLRPEGHLRRVPSRRQRQWGGEPCTRCRPARCRAPARARPPDARGRGVDPVPGAGARPRALARPHPRRHGAARRPPAHLPRRPRHRDQRQDEHRPHHRVAAARARA